MKLGYIGHTARVLAGDDNMFVSATGVVVVGKKAPVSTEYALPKPEKNLEWNIRVIQGT
jgi:hypothetical protein